MFCSYCGQDLPEDILICQACGSKPDIPNPIEENSTNEPEVFSTKEENQQNNDNNTNEQIIEEQGQAIEGQTPEREEAAYIPKNNMRSTTVDHNLTLQQLIENEHEHILERDQILDMNSKRIKPLKTTNFFLIQLVMLLPIINLILLCIWAFRGKTNLNLKAFARASLIWFVLLNILVLSLFITMLIMRYPISISHWFEDFKAYINYIDKI